VAGWAGYEGRYRGYSWLTSEALLSTSTTNYYYRCNNSQTDGNTPIVFTSDSTTVSLPSTYTALAWYNTEAIHAIAEALAFAGTVVARQSLGGDATFTPSNCPLPQDAASTVSSLVEDVTGFQIAVFMLFALAFLVASFVVFPVEERASLARHVQFVSGVNTTTCVHHQYTPRAFTKPQECLQVL